MTIQEPTKEQIMAQVDYPWPEPFRNYLRGAPFRNLLDLTHPTVPRGQWNPCWAPNENAQAHIDCPVWATTGFKQAHETPDGVWHPAVWRRGQRPPELAGRLPLLFVQFQKMWNNRLPVNLIWPDINPRHYMALHDPTRQPQIQRACVDCGAPLPMGTKAHRCPTCAARRAKRLHDVNAAAKLLAQHAPKG